MKIPIGKKIVFIKTIDCGPGEDHPAMIYARAGEVGTVTGYNEFEGYNVKGSCNPHHFGAKVIEEFLPVDESLIDKL